MELHKERTKARVFSRIIQMASPTFIVVAVFVPIGALVYAINFGPLVILNYVHIMAGALWTGVDLFMGFVLGPVLGTMDPKERTGVFMRLMPRMTFLMPVLAGVTATAGLQLTQRLGFSLVSPWILASFAITGILAVQALESFFQTRFAYFESSYPIRQMSTRYRA